MEDFIMGYTKGYVEGRIKKLKTNAVENANLIRKWERILRKEEAKK
jgi:hypothetical protein